MAQQIIKAQNAMVLVPRMQSVKVACRRLIAWSLEIVLVAISAAIPWGAGHYVLIAETINIIPVEDTVEASPNQSVWQDTVTLNPLVSHAQKRWAWMAQIPPYQLVRTVPRLTNIFWTIGLIAPVVVAGAQLTQLSLTGRTWPKRWLQLRMISMTGESLSMVQVIIREGVRWGGARMVVVGVTVITGFSIGSWMPAVMCMRVLLEGGTGLTPSKRSWHDRLANTHVVMATAGYLPLSSETLSYSLPLDGAYSSQESNSIQLYGESNNDDWWLSEAEGDLTSLVLPPRNIQSAGSLLVVSDPKRSSDRSWWLVAGGMMLACLTGFGIGRVVQTPATVAAEDDAFWQTVQTLMTKAKAEGDYNAAILTLAQIDDPRASSYLTDLLSQSSQPETLAAIQQALISQGLESLPALLALGHVLENDLRQSLDGETRSLRLEQRHVVQGAIAKLLSVHSAKLDGIYLDRVNLGRHQDSDRTFRLIQPGLLAAGTSWQKANLDHANLAKASFFDEGADGKPNSYDDIISDFRNVSLVAASLEQANLQGAQLDGANLRRAKLTDANLAYASLEGAQLTNARLIQANAPYSRWLGSNLVGADLTQAVLDAADLSKARHNRIEAAHSSWQNATLPQSDWVGANLIGADFNRANLVGADFQGAKLDGVDFTQADLRQANLRDANLRQATLTGVNLAEADLAGAIFDDGNVVTGSFITPNTQLSANHHLQGVNFSRVRNLDNRQLNYICAHGGIHPSCQNLLDDN